VSIGGSDIGGYSRGMEPDPTEQSVPPVTFGAALRFWFRLGCISFGGPAGQIAIMHRELVETRRWVSEGRFLHALNYCMVLPGPEAQQLATYLGWLLHRTKGGIVAGALFVLPSLLVLTVLSWLYVRFGTLPWVAGALYGVKPAVVAIVLQAAHRLGSRALGSPWAWGMALASFAAIALADVPFPIVLLVAAGSGVLLGRRLGSGAARGTKVSGPAPLPALIDDDTPRPPHTRFSARRLALTSGIAIGLGLAVFGALVGWQGAHGVLPAMGAFFTKAALLTFGGAYAVLPYVFDNAVNHHHWLSTAAMMDGLALGETTPGPLIMIVAFVGFLGAAQGTEHLLVSGATGAAVATFFTFLPSFLLVLAGGPLIESTRGNARFTAPLAAITAAVVGVIADLALVFGRHVLWPEGLRAPPDWIAAILLAAFAVALLRWKVGVIPLIAAAAFAGVVARVVP
jgi:chromate transporter